MPNKTNFTFNNGGTTNDFSEVFIPKSFFIQGNLLVVGNNLLGALGDETTVDKSSPVQTIAGGTNWKQVDTGTYNCAAIKSDGTLWTWGRNVAGELGNDDGARRDQSSPVQTISGGTNWKQVSCGGETIGAIKTDGTLWMWGNGDSGQLGNNAVNNPGLNSPTQTISGGTNWKQVSSGGGHTAAIKTDGTLWTWGSNNIGQLGDGTIVDKSSPVQTISGGTNWKQVSCGGNFTSAIKTDGTLWLWGDNFTSGVLGTGDFSSKSSPVQTISGGTNWKQVSSYGYHVAAIKTDGTLWTWGSNFYGELGTGNTTLPYSLTPVQTIAGGTNWKQVSCGYGHTATIKTDGTFWAWGADGSGCLGGTGNKSSPTQTMGVGTRWIGVGCGYNRIVTILDIS